LAWRLTDAAIREAERRNLRIAVAITDANGDLIQLDRMNGAPPMAERGKRVLARSSAGRSPTVCSMSM
jgi:uncharacterized protein GlcG (DUF336 family)